jgi:hypothetical protein
MSNRFTYVTVTDFKQEGRVEILARHTSRIKALSGFRRIAAIYYKIHKHRCWLVRWKAGYEPRMELVSPQDTAHCLGHTILFVGDETNGVITEFPVDTALQGLCIPLAGK